MKRLLIWDLPTRLFHWLLAGGVAISIWTGLTGGYTQMEIHLLSGYFILGLVLFRIVWGFIGHRYSRFHQFVKSPKVMLGYLRRAHPGEMKPGHNPWGAWSVIALLLICLVQTVSGLFANDDIMTEGPLTHLVSDDLSDWLTGIHEVNFWILASLITLHLAAVGWYTVIRKQALIRTMITGHTLSSEDGLPTSDEAVLTRPSMWIRFFGAAGFVSILVYGLVNHV